MTISAKIIAHSISNDGIELITYELEYPRMIHAEFMTHRMISKNAASSRAIPVKRAIELIETNTARPSHWGKNQPGMSAKEECHANIKVEGIGEIHFGRKQWWDHARDSAIYHAQEFDKAGYHKQIVNRLLEPFSHIKVVASATSFDNLFWLRRHKDAQPEFQELANAMWEAKENSAINILVEGEWHVPYYHEGFWTPFGNHADGAHTRRNVDMYGCTLEDALAISASCCAQVSYRKNDDSLDKARDIYKRLVESTPVHASPFEHQATPIEDPRAREDEQVLLRCLPENGELAEGITHFDRDGWAHSGNFKGWIQNRQLIPNNVCKEYNPNV